MRKPTLLEITLRTLVSAFKLNDLKGNSNPPNKVGEYRLIKKINKTKPFNNFASGIYEKKGQKYFIKTYEYTCK